MNEIKKINVDENMKFFNCSCHGEGLIIDENIEDKEIYVSLWSRNYDGKKLYFTDKVRWMWYILTKGKPYHDEIILTYEEAKKLGNHLIDLVKRREKEINNGV